MNRRVTLTVFGETKTIHDWAADPRCRIGRTTVYDRLSKGYTPEQALTAPARSVQPKVKAKPADQKSTTLEDEATAFGETKTLGKWASDPRCEVPARQLRVRVGRGWSLEDAMRAVSRPVVEQQRPNAPLYSGFGEKKRLSEWAKDVRCEVSAMTLRRRLSAGVPVEEALRAGTPDKDKGND